jgi:hypothetical protein
MMSPTGASVVTPRSMPRRRSPSVTVPSNRCWSSTDDTDMFDADIKVLDQDLNRRVGPDHTLLEQRLWRRDQTQRRRGRRGLMGISGGFWRSGHDVQRSIYVKC